MLEALKTNIMTGLILGIVIIILLIFLGIIVSVLNHSNIYVYPKTGSKYMIEYECKLKSPESGQWYHAIIYKNIKTGELYVRESKDFLDKFVKLKDWENGNKNK